MPEPVPSSEAQVPADSQEGEYQRRILLAGRWVETDRPLVARDAGGSSVVGHSWLAGAGELEEATAAAVAAFPVTRRASTYERRDFLRRVGAGVQARRDELAELLARESGKPIADARTEVDRTALAFDLAAGEAERVHGEVLPLDVGPASRGAWGVVRPMPIGPVAAITPFNVPLSLTAHKLAPAFAVGNPVVLKPDSRVALTVLTLAEIIADAGVEPGSFSALPMEVDVADAMVTDDRFRLLSFTGSARVGWDMRARAGTKRVVLELGGNAAVIVAADADAADACPRIVKGAFKHAGQLCISVQRLYVHRSRYDEVVERVVAATEDLRVGPPLDTDVDLGPMISEDAAARAVSWVEEAVADGATTLTGGRHDGAFMEPTVLVDVPETSRLCVEEAFAPVLVVEAFDDIDDAFARVNAGNYGLQAGVFTKDLDLAWHAFDELEVGGVMIGNVPTYRVDTMPYGGVKASGLGREGIKYAIEHMTEQRVMVVTPSGPS